jgi:aryl-alcohol dehydrogenase-like predicted oxidoreductase
LNQVRYSLIHREIETNGILETAKELGVTIVAYTPLGSGLLTGKYHQHPELLEKKSGIRKSMLVGNVERTRPLINAMAEIAGRYDATIGQVALNWLIHFNGDMVVTIPGATKVYQAQESAAAMNFTLSAEELARLSEISGQLK